MIVHTNNTTYKVDWEHDPEMQMTTCKITDMSNNKGCIGTTIVHPDDNYNKNTGRKISLQRALNYLFPYNDNRFEGNNYHYHGEFWTEYNKMRGHKW